MRLDFLRSIACLFAVVLLIGTPALAGPPGPTPEGPLPPLRVEPPVFDAGFIEPEDLINATFRIVNPTREPMIIDGFTTSCKCTAPIINERVIPVGGFVEVSANVDLRGTIGQIRKSFTLKIRGWDRPITCVIEGFMTTKVRVEPKRLDRTSGRLRLTATDARPFAPIAIHNEGAEFEFVAVSPRGARKATVWDVVYRLPSNSADTSLLIETDHKKSPVVAPRLYTAAASRLELEYFMQRNEVYTVRTHAIIGVLDHGESYEFDCQIKRDDHSTPLELRTETPGLDAEVLGHTEIFGEDTTRMYTIRLTNNGVPAGGIMTPLYFKTDAIEKKTGEPGTFETRIWLLGVVREGAPAQDNTEHEAVTESAAEGEE